MTIVVIVALIFISHACAFCGCPDCATIDEALHLYAKGEAACYCSLYVSENDADFIGMPNLARAAFFEALLVFATLISFTCSFKVFITYGVLDCE